MASRYLRYVAAIVIAVDEVMILPSNSQNENDDDVGDGGRRSSKRGGGGIAQFSRVGGLVRTGSKTMDFGLDAKRGRFGTPVRMAQIRTS
jgi:hypothetical protein